MQQAPLPPQRPFDLDPRDPATPLILVPTPKPLPQPPGAAAAPASAAAEPPESGLSETDEEEGPEWPKLTPGQKAGAEPDYDPNERAEQPGISTDRGTSIACLPPPLKGVLNKIAERYGAVKVTSAWRPAWRARRNSFHRRCEAMDLRVPGVRPREVLEFARALPEVGGNKVYWNGIIHLDTGPRRAW